MFKEMKKLEYLAPEFEEIKLLHNIALLGGSNEGDDDDQQAPGTGNAEGL